MLLMIKKRNPLDLLGEWKEDKTFLEIFGRIYCRNLTYGQVQGCIVNQRVWLQLGRLGGWMPESLGRWSGVGLGRRNLVTMRKASFRTLSLRRV